ncbi:MAG: FecR domain-containing protein [Bacteroidetes bacterium]|nr:FecR domain-containing protein [Bacteroidota bacterium]
MKEQRFEELFRKYLYERLTDAEETELFHFWLDPTLENQRTQTFNHLYESLPYHKDIPDKEADLIFQQILKKQSPLYQMPARSAGSIWRRLAVASVVLLMMGISGYYFLGNKWRQPKETVQVSYSDDIHAPETSRAMITLSNGQKIYLDSAASGSLTTQGNVKLIKLADGKIAYKGKEASSSEVNYNTLSNPRGSRVIDMTLTDGSRVWLNSGSSVTYPVSFTGRERNVSVEGEAYFEVAHDAVNPFIVHKGQTAIRVLGTHFNVNAYEDESDLRVTLLQGAVQVTNQQYHAVIKPGEQAIVKQEGINLARKVDLEQVMSWKDGYFRMKGTDLASLMRQIARWYDVEVVYENRVPKVSFGGSINRDVSLSDVLKALEQYGINSGFDHGKIIIQ